MKYEVEIIKEGKIVDNYIATEYKTVTPRGRLGHKIDKDKREVTEVNILQEGKKRNKNYSSLFGGYTVIIREMTTGRRVFTLEPKLFNSGE